jgi:hypothetical protein
VTEPRLPQAGEQGAPAELKAAVTISPALSLLTEIAKDGLADVPAVTVSDEGVIPTTAALGGATVMAAVPATGVRLDVAVRVTLVVAATLDGGVYDTV